MTPEELDAALTRAYNEGRDAEWQRIMTERTIPINPFPNGRLDRAGRLAVARYSAQRQHDVDMLNGNMIPALWMDE